MTNAYVKMAAVAGIATGAFAATNANAADASRRSAAPANTCVAGTHLVETSKCVPDAPIARQRQTQGRYRAATPCGSVKNVDIGTALGNQARNFRTAAGPAVTTSQWGFFSDEHKAEALGTINMGAECGTGGVKVYATGTSQEVDITTAEAPVKPLVTLGVGAEHAAADYFGAGLIGDVINGAKNVINNTVSPTATATGTGGAGGAGGNASAKGGNANATGGTANATVKDSGNSSIKDSGNSSSVANSSSKSYASAAANASAKLVQPVTAPAQPKKGGMGNWGSKPQKKCNC